MLFKCLLEPATVLQKKKKEKKGTEELPWVSKVGHFHFHESGIFRPLCLVVHNATNRTVPKHSTKCPLGFEFRWFVSGLSFVFLFVRFCYCCLVVVVVVAPHPHPPAHINPQEEVKHSLSFCKMIENFIIEQCWLYRTLYMVGREAVLNTQSADTTSSWSRRSYFHGNFFLSPLLTGLFFLPPENH